ncbi:MAG: formylglycine-generating enzyme family protein [Opitutales bacterium]
MSARLNKIAKWITCLSAAVTIGAASASAAITIDTVSVGDANNKNDNNGYGAVSYGYHIGTYEVTNRQYTAFLNAVAGTDTHGLYNSNMGSNAHGGILRIGTSGSFTYFTRPNMAYKPVNYVSFWDAARFANWLTNGQGTGAQDNSTTEAGMYNLGGTTTPTNSSVTRQLDFALGQNGVAVASENEWYKAAYYDGSGGYFAYPTQSNSITTADANYAKSVGTVTDVGAYAADSSHYGTFDQGGNVWEWNDAIVSTSNRGMRGGSFGDVFVSSLRSSGRSLLNPPNEVNGVGFRVSSLAPIPEPSAYAAILGCLGLTLVLIRRKKRGTPSRS